MLDVREPIEFSMARLAPSALIPLGKSARRCERELGGRRHEEIIVVCHHGIRSVIVAEWLRGQGFTRVKNLDGGIDRWAAEVDPAIPRYRGAC